MVSFGNVRLVVRDSSNGIKPFLVQLSKLYQKKSLIVKLFSSILVLVLLTSTAQSQLSTIVAKDKGSDKEVTVNGIEKQNQLITHSVDNFSS